MSCGDEGAREAGEAERKPGENVPEVYQRHKGEVCAHEDEVGLPLEFVDEGRCDHDDYKVLNDR